VAEEIEEFRATSVPSRSATTASIRTATAMVGYRGQDSGVVVIAPALALGLEQPEPNRLQERQDAASQVRGLRAGTDSRCYSCHITGYTRDDGEPASPAQAGSAG
jgi:hypothetical protein